MSVDYDLIIFGATPAGVQAAIAAATLKARVALILQGITPADLPAAVPHYAWLDLASRLETQPPGNLLGSPFCSSDQLSDWTAAITANVEAACSASGLAHRGIDVIADMGEFCRQPAIGVRVGNRRLQARGYLLAMGVCSWIPAIAGLETAGYLTSEMLHTQIQKLAACQTITIIGSGKTAVELAQTLIRFGMGVTLMTQHDSLLPAADIEAARLIQAQLEAEGVRVLLKTSIAQVRSHGGKKQLQMNHQTLTTDEIIVAAGHSPNVKSLNLEAAGVRWNANGIWHNAKLQTTNPRVYVCDGQLGTESVTQVAKQEAAIALRNILFFPTSTMDYCTIPLTVHTSPNLAWLGLTEAQARQKYGKHLYVLRQSFNVLPQAQIRNDLTGLCKLVIHRNGTILGGHIIGAFASEWIGLLAFAMQQNLKIQAIASLPLPSPTLAEILQYTAIDFRCLQLKHNHRLRDLFDYFFDLRRAWFR
ncbi:pyruvate/2-oxoglutarate dehydrogenase complex, dihydrolipoamide dehydrogenase component [Leptolyngbyaceae cyanobacterium JSC-12]|nr:pyruvate/2-oxoglutarate dehydrogenase complex, dihydrolipoamide dehydrogenase component [Leptolyngbyaceae cyanobacterium JSC-12]